MTSLEYQQDQDTLVIGPHGNLNVKMMEQYWDPTMRKLSRTEPLRVRVDGSDVSTCDGVGIAFLLEIQEKQEQQKRPFVLEGFRDDLMELIESNRITCDVHLPAKVSWIQKIIENIGHSAHQIMAGFCKETAFLGELVSRSVSMLAHPGRFRCK